MLVCLIQWILPLISVFTSFRHLCSTLYIIYVKHNCKHITCLPNRGFNTIMSWDLLTQCQQKGCKSWRGQQVSSGAECGGSARGLGALTSENSFQLQIRAERKHLPVSYLLPNVNTQYPDRARPTANTPAQSSYYYNPLALCTAGWFYYTWASVDNRNR